MSYTYRLIILLCIPFVSCIGHDDSQAEGGVFTSDIDLKLPDNWEYLDVDSMVAVHNDSLLFLNYWSGMSPDEFKAVTEKNLSDNIVKTRKSEGGLKSLPTGGFESTLLVEYKIHDTIALEFNMFYLAPIEFEDIDRKNYRSDRDLRESPNGGIVLFTGQRDNKYNSYVDSLIQERFEDKSTFYVEIGAGSNHYYMDDSVCIGTTMYSIDRPTIGVMSSLIIRSITDGQYLEKHCSHPPDNYVHPEYGY